MTYTLEGFFNPVIFCVGILCIFFMNSPALLFNDRYAWREFIECSLGGSVVFTIIFFIAKYAVKAW